MKHYCVREITTYKRRKKEKEKKHLVITNIQTTG